MVMWIGKEEGTAAKALVRTAYAESSGMSVWMEQRGMGRRADVSWPGIGSSESGKCGITVMSGQMDSRHLPLG